MLMVGCKLRVKYVFFQVSVLSLDQRHLDQPQGTTATYENKFPLALASLMLLSEGVVQGHLQRYLMSE